MPRIIYTTYPNISKTKKSGVKMRTTVLDRWWVIITPFKGFDQEGRPPTALFPHPPFFSLEL